MRSLSSWSLWAVAMLAAVGQAAPMVEQRATNSTASSKLVFAHFMVGIVADRTSAADYDADMKNAKAAGIDAFALNIGTDTWATQQLTYAYESAANNDMKVFISFDFNYFSTSDASGVGAIAKQFISLPGQLQVDSKPLVSSFVGDGVDLAGIESAAGQDLYLALNLSPSSTPSSTGLDGALNWVSWDTNGANRAPTSSANVTSAQQDATYETWLAGKGYIAPVSPWFYTHYSPSTYNKNWVFPGDLQWWDRWNEVLALGPQMIEIISWNDYGESHYVGPLSSEHNDDGASKWANEMSHNGWLSMAVPFIKAFKAGSKDVSSYITEDQLVYWYRPHPKAIDCDSTDSCGAKPEGYDVSFEDKVFVVSFLTEDATVTVSSGSNAKSFDAQKGANVWEVDMGVGKQTFAIVRGGTTVASVTDALEIADSCPCGVYNYNAHTGTVPAGAADALAADGLAKFNSDKATTCSTAPVLSG